MKTQQLAENNTEGTGMSSLEIAPYTPSGHYE